MSNTPEPQTPPRSWAARHKRLTWTVAIVLLLILSLALGALYYIRSGRLNRNINIESDGARISFSSSQVRVNAATVQGNRLTGAAVDQISGEVKDGITRANAQRIRIAQVRLHEGQVKNVAVTGIHAEVSDGRTQATARQATVAAVTLHQGQVTGLALRGATATVENEWQGY